MIPICTRAACSVYTRYTYTHIQTRCLVIHIYVYHCAVFLSCICIKLNIYMCLYMCIYWYHVCAYLLLHMECSHMCVQESITSKPLNSLFVKLMRTVQTIYIFADQVRTAMSTCRHLVQHSRRLHALLSSVNMALSQDEVAATTKGWEETRCRTMTL